MHIFQPTRDFGDNYSSYILSSPPIILRTTAAKSYTIHSSHQELLDKTTSEVICISYLRGSKDERGREREKDMRKLGQVVTSN